MSISTKQLVCLVALALSLTVSSVASAAFTSFVIRENAGNPPVIQPRNDVTPGALEFITALSSQKAGWGSNDVNGASIGQLANVSITRHDDTTRFPLGSGPAFAPYLNIWVTDGLGNFAVLANEPTNPSFQPLFVDNGNGTKSYNFDFADIANEPVQVYETVNGGFNSTNTWVHNLVGINGPLTYANVANLTIGAPSAAYIANPVNAVGSGAPRQIVTNIAYGVNWIFGDTLSNYVSGGDGFIVSAPGVSAVPEPGTAALVGLGLASFFVVRRRSRG